MRDISRFMFRVFKQLSVTPYDYVEQKIDMYGDTYS